MKIDGKTIAATIYDSILKRVGELQRKNITPTLAVILVGNDPSSENYVNQKLIHAEKVGVKLTIDRYHTTTLDELKPIIEKMNMDSSIHGIIIQRPLDSIADADLDTLVAPLKDVDGFHPQSPYDPPVAKAVIKLLQNVHPENFEQWLALQTISVVGKGRTAGGPIIKLLTHKYKLTPQIIDSKTEDRVEKLKVSNIIISAVGKKHAITPEMIEKGTILIGVGLHSEEDGKLHGDFVKDEIIDIASYYSGTPGGVGPVNVAMLLQNVVESAEKALTNQ